MTQLQALKELAEKVESGYWPIPKVVRLSFPYVELGIRDDNAAATNAMYGSLDAAHALHKAVLGERWEWSIGSWGCSYWPADSGYSTDEIHFEDRDMPRARLRLLAIIKAKIQELEK